MTFSIESRLVPKTPHRLPHKEGYCTVIRKLSRLGVDASCFLMNETEISGLDRLYPNPPNNAAAAYQDLLEQLPPDVRNSLRPFAPDFLPSPAS